MDMYDKWIRWMVRKDLPEVLDFGRRASVVDGVWPWTQEEYISFLRQRNCISMVAEHTRAKRVCGVMIYELHNGFLRVVQFLVDPDERRRGYGRLMLDKLRGKLSSSIKRTRVEFDVPERALGMAMFLRHHGIKCTSTMPGGDDGDIWRFQMDHPTRKEEHDHANA